VSRFIVSTLCPDGIADMAASVFYLSIVTYNREKLSKMEFRENKARRTRVGKIESTLWLPRSAPPFILSWDPHSDVSMGSDVRSISPAEKLRFFQPARI
jgi:hypothetical protein